MKAIEILHKVDTEFKYAYLDRDACIRSDNVNEAIEEIEDLQDKLTKAQSYIIELEDKLRGYIRENGY